MSQFVRYRRRVEVVPDDVCQQVSRLILARVPQLRLGLELAHVFLLTIAEARLPDNPSSTEYANPLT